MAEESHHDEMNAAIRAQRERGAVPRSMLPPKDDATPEMSPPEMPPPPPPPEPAPPKRRLLDRLLGR